MLFLDVRNTYLFFLIIISISVSSYYAQKDLISIPLLFLAVFYLIKNKNPEKIYYLLTPFFLLLFPWSTYNIAITSNTALKTGTSDWHDMKSLSKQN